MSRLCHLCVDCSSSRCVNGIPLHCSRFSLFEKEKVAMKDIEIKGMVLAHCIIAVSIVMATIVPAVLLDDYSVYGTHMVWLYICTVGVAAVNIAIYTLLGVSPPAKKNTLSYKVTKVSKSCLYFMFSCLLFHGIVVLYGAPLLESASETFSFAVLLSTFTTLRCLCILGPNVQAWIRVFSRNGAMSIWDTSLQITTASSVIGAWLGAFPIPLDWERPWQVWPISCTLGATLGFVAGLFIAPIWIHWHRKQLTYKSK